jgi:hypothetical protein
VKQPIYGKLNFHLIPTETESLFVQTNAETKGQQHNVMLSLLIFYGIIGVLYDENA